MGPKPSKITYSMLFCQILDLGISLIPGSRGLPRLGTIHVPVCDYSIGDLG